MILHNASPMFKTHNWNWNYSNTIHDFLYCTDCNVTCYRDSRDQLKFDYIHGLGEKVYELTCNEIVIRKIL